MSLINRVLQDLEARRGDIEGRPLPNEVRALPPQRRRLLWPLLVVGVFSAVAVAVYFGRPEPISVVVVPPQGIVLDEPAVAQRPLITTPAFGREAGQAKAAESMTRKLLLAEPPLRPVASHDDTHVVITKEVRSATARERANTEYGKAIAALNQGRQEQAVAGLRAALTEDPVWAPPRQALLGLLLEAQRLDEAQELLQQGLAQNPAQPELAMQLARIQVERKDPAAAADTLRSVSAQASGNADYHGLNAAVLNRLGRHREAILAYQSALRLMPRAGLWWMGLGISLEADGRAAEAREAYLRARDSGVLASDMATFVEQKLKGGNGSSQ